MAYSEKFVRGLKRKMDEYPIIVKVLSPEKYDRLKEIKQKIKEIGRVPYAFTRINKDGRTFIFVSDTNDEAINDKFIAHEIREIAIFKKNLGKGILNERLAHKMNIGRLPQLEWK